MKTKILIIPKKIITVNMQNEILENFAVEIIEGKISKIDKKENFNFTSYNGQVYNFENYILIPGFIQTHIHLCQTLFRGLADDLELLDWLQKKIFRFENTHNKESIRTSAQLGIAELFSNGTTTILDMGTINHQGIIFEELISSKMRAYAGKCMMNENELYPKFKEDLKSSLDTSIDLAKEFHNCKNGKIKYAFAPRFVLSCSENLLRATSEIVKEMQGTLFHTHASENISEVEIIKEQFGMGNIEYFGHIGVLSDRTMLAHCIHVSENEIELLQKFQTRVLHCPSANLKLGSGIAPIPRYLEKKISVSLGADGAPCNNNLNVFTEMRLASLIQKPIYGPTTMDSLSTFKLATIEGAKALHLEKEIGSIEVNKKADLVLLDLNKFDKPLNDENLYSTIVYSTGKDSVKEVMVEGEWVVRNGISTIFDEDGIVQNGKNELKKLLGRI
ncbi:MAG: amidohydrolase family protein [Ignavibacteriales bacterium]|nr:amidohydrolase family protein [Ignavibacteriales bacterium]